MIIGMTQGIISDITQKTLRADATYKVSVYSRGHKVHLDFDCEMMPQLLELLKLARQNGCQWYALQKDDEGKWERVEKDYEVPNPRKKRENGID